MHRKLLTYCSLSLLLFVVNSQTIAQNYSISVEIPEAADSSIYLAHYFGKQVFVDDTISLDNKGCGAFQGDSLLNQGLYLIYLNKNQFTDFLLGSDQSMKIKYSLKNPDELTIRGAKESELFANYKLFLKKQKREQTGLIKRKKENQNNKDSINYLNNKLKELNDQVKNYWFSEAEKYPDTFYSKFLLSNYIQMPNKNDIPEKWVKNDSLLWVYEYNFRKDHYWDYLDVSDPRFMFTPVLHSRLENYLDKILIQKPDSVTPYALNLIEKSKNNPKTFQYMCTTLLNHFIQSKMMGMDATFVRIAENYYLTGQASWADSTTLVNIAQQVYFKRNNLLGMKAQDFKMESLDGPYYRLHEVDSEFTVLVFWEPECGHCKKQIPQLYNEVFKKNEIKDVNFMAICTIDDKEKWQEFIETNNLFEWINLWDPQNLTNFRINYDIQSTPRIFILDKDKKILAKNINPESTKQILDLLLSGKRL